MPMYEFQCKHCGLQFDKRRSVAKRDEVMPCEACGKVATLLPPPSVAGHFKKEVTGPVPQNTGIHDLDTHIDRVIGQSAAQGHAVIDQRHRDKLAVLDQTGAKGEDLSKNLDGSYRVMSPEEKAVHQRSQAIHSTAMDWRQKRGSRRRSR